MGKPVVPADIIDEIELKEPISIKKTATLIRDIKKHTHTTQYSIKFPTGIIEEIMWNAGDKIEIEIENDYLKLRKVKG
jgi:hypothetical protein